MAKNHPDLVVKPEVKIAIIPTIFWSFLGFGILIAIGIAILNAFNVPLNPTIQSLLLPGWVFLSVLAIALEIMNLRSTEYRFYGDKIEFYQGFLNIHRSLIRYDKITDIELGKSVWERMWNVGHISINTAGSSSFEIRLTFVKNTDKVYETIQRLVKSGSKKK